MHVLFNGNSPFHLRRLLAYLRQFPLFPTGIHRILTMNTSFLTDNFTVIRRSHLRVTVNLRAIQVLFNWNSPFFLRRLRAYLQRFPVFTTAIHRILATNTCFLTNIFTVIYRSYLRVTSKFTGI